MHLIGHHIIRLEETDSTNNYAYNLLTTNKQAEGIIVLADHQTKGKGQGDNQWESEKSLNILMSLILKPKFLHPFQQFYLNMAISLAVADTVKEVTGKEALIKWPNDILVNKKKIAGILIMNTIDSKRINSSIVGIGLNVNQYMFNEHTKNPTSVIIETGREQKLDEVFDKLLLNLRNYYFLIENCRFKELKKLYLKNLLFFGKEVFLKHRDKGILSGILQDISEYGEIKVSTDKGLIILNHEMVRLII